MIYVELFLTFFLIGMFTIGGGYAMLSLIQNQVVTIHGWIDDPTFTDIVAISQMTPGPIGINSATYVGYEVLSKAGASELLSILGSFTATFAVVLPSFFIVLLLAKVYDRWKEHPIFRGVMTGLRPAVLGLTVYSVSKAILNESLHNMYLKDIAGACSAFNNELRCDRILLRSLESHEM